MDGGGYGRPIVFAGPAQPVLACDDLSARQAASRFRVSVSYVIKARQRRDRTGEVGTLSRGSRRQPMLARHAALLTIS